MSIVQTINFSAFRRAFDLAGRSNQFSDSALEALFNHLESLSEDTGEAYELDVISLCVGYCEATADEVIHSYNLFDTMESQTEEEDDEEFEDRKVMEVHKFLNKRTTLVQDNQGDTFLFVNF